MAKASRFRFSRAISARRDGRAEALTERLEQNSELRQVIRLERAAHPSLCRDGESVFDLHHEAIFQGIVARGSAKSSACGSLGRYQTRAGLLRPRLRDPRVIMTVIALVLAGNLLLAGLFSIVAVALD